MTERVPRIIHQIWINDTHLDPNNKRPIPAIWHKGIAKWKALPDTIHLLWDDVMVWEFLRGKYPSFIKLYLSYPYLIQRADMIRYLILYEFGGVYCDLDLYPADNEKNIFNFLTHSAPSFVASANSDCFTNALMASPPGSPLMRELMNGLKHKMENMPWWCMSKHLVVMFSTGPMYLTERLRNTKHTFVVLPKARFNAYSLLEEFTENKPGALIHTVEGNSWHSWDSTAVNFVFRNQRVFAMLGVLLVILLIAGAFYFAARFRRVKKICGKKCSKV